MNCILASRVMNLTLNQRFLKVISKLIFIEIGNWIRNQMRNERSKTKTEIAIEFEIGFKTKSKSVSKLSFQNRSKSKWNLVDNFQTHHFCIQNFHYSFILEAPLNVLGEITQKQLLETAFRKHKTVAICGFV